MRWPAIAALGAAAYAVFLVATMPASFVVAKMPRNEGVALDEARGTFWNGSARATILASRPPVTLDRLAWRFAPSQLLAGRFAFDVEATDPRVSGRVRLSRGLDGRRADGIDVRADAALASAVLPLVAPWRPAGTVTVKGSRLDWDERDTVRGDAILEWQAASIALPGPRALGSYRVELKGDGGPMRATLTTLGGALALRGEGTVAPNALSFQGEARGQGPQAESVAPVLDLIGPRRPDGSRAFTLRLP